MKQETAAREHLQERVAELERTLQSIHAEHSESLASLHSQLRNAVQRRADEASAAQVAVQAELERTRSQLAEMSRTLAAEEAKVRAHYALCRARAPVHTPWLMRAGAQLDTCGAALQSARFQQAIAERERELQDARDSDAQTRIALSAAQADCDAATAALAQLEAIMRQGPVAQPGEPYQRTEVARLQALTEAQAAELEQRATALARAEAEAAALQQRLETVDFAALESERDQLAAQLRTHQAETANELSVMRADLLLAQQVPVKTAFGPEGGPSARVSRHGWLGRRRRR